jgi:hypothetical protein
MLLEQSEAPSAAVNEIAETKIKKAGLSPADPCGYEWDEMQPRKRE